MSGTGWRSRAAHPKQILLFVLLHNLIMMLNLVTLLAATGTASTKTAARQAVEDGIVIFAFTLFSSLIALGWPPSLSTTYVPFLSAGLIGLTTYAKARGIDVTGTKTDDATATTPTVPPKV